MAKIGKNKLSTVRKKQPEKGDVSIKSGSSVRDVVQKATESKPIAKKQTSKLALKPSTPTTTSSTSVTTDKDNTPTKSIAQHLADLEATQRAAIEQKKVEQAKSLGRSSDAARRVSSATRISGLRGLEPRLGMQFYKKKTEE